MTEWVDQTEPTDQSDALNSLGPAHLETTAI